MKGIILAGGHGTRLHPLTKAISKQLLPVYDKPMIYYPLCTLIECGITEICVITTELDLARFTMLLGFGEQWGLRFRYEIQREPKGIADAFLVAEEFIGDGFVALILGDNIFTDNRSIAALAGKFKAQGKGAAIVGYYSGAPERYGVMCFDHNGCLSGIEEKPKQPKSAYVVTGVYFYDGSQLAIAKTLKPSARGELEITDINNAYINHGRIEHIALDKPTEKWLDAGTPDDLHWASSVVRSAQLEQGCKIGCPDEAAKRMRGKAAT